MGLPIHRNSALAQSPSKNDPTAHARSAIRRQPTLRTRPTLHPDLVLNAIVEQSSPEPLLQEDRSDDRYLYGNVTAASQSQIRARSGAPVSADQPTTSTHERERELDTAPYLAPDGWALTTLRSDQPTPPRPFTRRRLDSGDYEPSFTAWPPSDMAPLRRMSRHNDRQRSSTQRRRSSHRRAQRYARLTPAPEINGLGDRQRSWSPDSDRDQWDTLLTTITPDPSLPSASSSFASAAQPPAPIPANASARTMQQRRESSPPLGLETTSTIQPQDLYSLENGLLRLRDDLETHQQQPEYYWDPDHTPFLPLPPLPAPYSTAPEAFTGDLRINYNYSLGAPPRNLPIDADGNCPFVPPSRTLASPSVSSDSEEGSAESDASQRTAIVSYNSASNSSSALALDPARTLPPIDVRTTQTRVVTEDERNQFSLQQNRRVLSLGETLIDFFTLGQYLERHRLPLPADLDMPLVMHHLDRLESMLSGVAQRQREYLLSSGIERYVGGPLNAFHNRFPHLSRPALPSAPISPSRSRRA